MAACTKNAGSPRGIVFRALALTVSLCAAFIGAISCGERDAAGESSHRDASPSASAPATIDRAGAERARARGEELSRHGQAVKAAAAFEAALTADPSQLELRGRLAKLYLYQLQDPENARRQLARWQSDAPQDPEPIYLQGKMALNDADFDRAARQFEKALELDPDHLDSWSLLGEVHEARGELDAAEHCYRQVLEKDPSNAGALYRQGKLATLRGRFEEGKRALMAVIDSNPGHGGAHQNLARCLLQLGDEASAKQHLEIQRLLVLYGSGTKVDRNADPSQRAQIERRLIELNPRYSPPYFGLASYDVAQHRGEEAAELLRGLIALKPSAARPHLELARVLESLGQAVEAKREQALYAELSRDGGDDGDR